MADYQLWRMNTSGDSHLIARPVSMTDAERAVEEAKVGLYTYAFEWSGGRCRFLVGKIGGAVDRRDLRTSIRNILRGSR